MLFLRLWLALWVCMLSGVDATKVIKSQSLLTCMDNSQFTATKFDVVLYPENSTVYFDISALSTIPDDTFVVANITLVTYGLIPLKQSFDFCSLNYPSICPFQPGHLDIQSSYTLDKKIMDMIPGIAYTIPDLDARVRVVIHSNSSTEPLACVEAVLSNDKTVQTKYASWPIAAISGLGVIASGVVSVIGHSNTAAHIASNSMSLFIYFQSLAIISMQAVAKVPPIAAAWSQNFQWSLGIIKVGFVQAVANWYIQATGGTPTSVIDQRRLSVSVQKKRGLGYLEQLHDLYRRQLQNDHLTLFKRFSLSVDTDASSFDNTDSDLYTTSEKDANLASKILVLRGIQRVAYLAGIEITSFFMTSIMFLLFFAFVLVVCLMFFKAIVEICVRAKWMNEGKFSEYRQQWGHIIKGSLYRLCFISLPQITVMCIWQFFERDSAGTVVLSAFLLGIWIILLVQAAGRVVMMGRQSVREFKNPAYLLFGDGKFLNKFGFIYVQYRADKYWWIAISLIYIVLKSLFVAVLQNQGKPQALIVFIIELIYCVAVCVFRPFMDKRTNAFNITIAIINTINALFFAFFSNIFTQPAVVSSVMAIVYFVLNAVFALFLLLFTIITCLLALIYKNPDTRYQPMKDDRVSFLPRFTGKSAQHQNDKEEYELFQLGQTAMKGHEHGKGGAYEDSVYEAESYYPESSKQGSGQGKVTFTDEVHSINNRDSYYMEPIEPVQPTSTIGGTASSFGGSTSYGGSQYGGSQYGGSRSAYTTPAYESPAPPQHGFPSTGQNSGQGGSSNGPSAYSRQTGYTPRY
ncbi:hypothetical protein DIURU_004233 [Diutina rugosa]|uniref:ML-like domain-containing protein n=1 Tax=Diutina rugosa TaxID=5481 RepID=A0A642UI86_DIURU|nr:uncharacterized protein DIURU_004233 [Diutina rugosa]KAA8899566.1 hypothetical protein DIURU_004233 [Diutina rugosa]